MTLQTIPPTEQSYSPVQVKPEVISAVHSLFKPDSRYLRSAEITGGEGTIRNYKISGKFNIDCSGHWALDTGLVHSQDSEAAAAQLGFALFIHGSMEGLFREVPVMPLEELMQIIANKKGGAWLYGANKRTSGALPKECNGCMEITGVRGSGSGLGYFVDARVVMGESTKSHRMDMEYVIRF